MASNMTFGVNIIPKANANVTLGNSDHPWTIPNPSLTGTPTAPTATAGTSTTQIATTAFVESELGDYAPKANPEFTGSISMGRAANTTNGTNSAAIGSGNTASGYYSQAEGLGTTANHLAQHVFGEYNLVDTSSQTASNRGNFLEIVGNGTTSSSRSNARTLDWDGNEKLMGDLYVGVSANGSGGTKVLAQGATWGEIKGT